MQHSVCVTLGRWKRERRHTSRRGSTRWVDVAFHGSPLTLEAALAAFPTVLNRAAMEDTERADLSCWAPSCTGCHPINRDEGV
jgi:hypothetical protein